MVTKNLKRELLYRNENSIERTMTAIVNTKPLVEAIVSTWLELKKATPELSILNNDNLSDLINEPDAFIKNELSFVYSTLYGKTHSALGITAKAGIDLVDLPDLSPVIAPVLAYFDKLCNDARSYVDTSYFKLDGQTIIVNQSRVDQYIDSESLFVETELEHKLKGQFISLIYLLTDIEKTLNESTRLSLFSDNGFETKADFKKLSMFINSTFDRFSGATGFELRNEFFKQLKDVQSGMQYIN
jgi:hypothetical protein